MVSRRARAGVRLQRGSRAQSERVDEDPDSGGNYASSNMDSIGAGPLSAQWTPSWVRMCQGISRLHANALSWIWEEQGRG